VGDSGCSAGDTHMDTRGQWVTVAVVLAIHIWIHALAIGRISNTDMSIGQLNTCATRCRFGQCARRHA